MFRNGLKRVVAKEATVIIKKYQTRSAGLLFVMETEPKGNGANGNEL